MERADLIIEELVRCGASQFFIAPGSRSTPLVAAAATNPRCSVIVHYDERGTAFAAVGYARAAGRAAVWITTSGTAVANGLPAVVEASQDGVPVILLTADRPPELREAGANQAILQPGIFGAYVRWSFDLPAPDSRIDPAFVLTTVDQAAYRARSGQGPVHLNCMFRKPLEPLGGPLIGPPAEGSPPEAPSHIKAWMTSDTPYTDYVRFERLVEAGGVSKIRDVMQKSSHPVIVLARSFDRSYESRVVRWAAEIGIPVLPDISSPYRTWGPGDSVIPHWDVLTSNSNLKQILRPDLILQFGRGTVSSCWEKEVITRVVIDSSSARIDPGHRVSIRATADSAGVRSLVESLDNLTPVEESWLGSWQAFDAAVTASITGWISDDAGGADQITEEKIAVMAPECCFHDSFLVLGNSLTVRNVDRYAATADHEIRVIVNRGASGIDGTIASAAGAAVGAASGDMAASTHDRSGERPRVMVLLGDQSLLHDMNSLSLARAEGLIVVVVNNDGGRIFHRLPISAHTDIFDKYFVGPHGYSFQNAAEQFGLHYACPETMSGLRSEILNAFKKEEGALIEARIDFEANEQSRTRLEMAVSEALAATGKGRDRS